MKILIVEDEPALLDSIQHYMLREGFICETAKNYFIASDKILMFEYDIILLDITLPDGNGLELLKELKKENATTGVIIISAKNSLDDKLTGLDIGADDYLTKPFHLAELNARVKAVIRRKNFSGKESVVFNEITIKPELTEITVGNKQIELTKKEYDLLLYFITNKNRVLSKEAIAEHLWGDYMETAGNFDFVYTHIKNLRKKIMAAGGNDYIKTAYGFGYKFTEH
ncbi:MAG: response regulator transcription factor [Fimbriimonadaceae bacterium]|nr:response regulator transcription factor [Chitinophagales bacterium]